MDRSAQSPRTYEAQRCFLRDLEACAAAHHSSREAGHFCPRLLSCVLWGAKSGSAQAFLQTLVFLGHAWQA